MFIGFVRFLDVLIYLSSQTTVFVFKVTIFVKLLRVLLKSRKIHAKSLSKDDTIVLACLFYDK